MASNICKFQTGDWFEWAFGYGKITALNKKDSYTFELHKYNGNWTQESDVSLRKESEHSIFRKYSWSIDPQYIRPVDRQQAEANLPALYQKKAEERQWILLHSRRSTSREEAAPLGALLNLDVASIIQKY